MAPMWDIGAGTGPKKINPALELFLARIVEETYTSQH
jgi:hypothetical protein